MKRVSIILIGILLCSLQGKAQFWISFGWNEPHCQNCLWMEQAIRMNNRQAAEYHKIIHKYGQRIEKEARRPYRYWERSAQAIYKLRMERDRKLQRVLTPSQFRLYVRFVREAPTRIHDWKGWFNNPHYPDYRPTDICFRYEDHYWHTRWEYANDRWHDHFDDHGWYRGKFDRPGHDNGHKHPAWNNRPQHDNGRPHSDKIRPDRNNSRPDYNGHRDKSNRDKFDKDRNDKRDKNKNQRSGQSKRSERMNKNNKDKKDSGNQGSMRKSI